MYWHSVRHVVPVLQKLSTPACLLSDELFESEFRPVKHLLRGRSNNRVGRDLLALRAFAEARSLIRKEWCANEAIPERVWGAAVSMDLLVAPCLMQEPVLLVNLPGLLKAVAQIDSALLSTVSIEDHACLKICCGDVPDILVLCTCGNHQNVDRSGHSGGYVVDDEALSAARKILESDMAEATGPLPQQDMEDCASSIEERQSTNSTHAVSSSASSRSLSSGWEPRAYFDDGPASQPSEESDNEEPWAKRLRPIELGEFFSENYGCVDGEEAEYELPSP